MTDDTRPDNRWRPGESGNPNGRPAGSRNKATVLIQALLEDGAEEVANKLITAAKEGDLAAAKFILERVVPPMRERPIRLDLPDTSTARGLSEAQQAILKAVSDGDVLPGEASTLSTVIEARRKAMETLELEKRITALEERQNAKS